MSRRLLLAVVACLAVPILDAQSKRPITEQDLLRFVWIADPQISPAGKDVAFVRVVVNEKSDDYETSIWTVPFDGSRLPRALTSGTRDTTPRWSPDGTRLAFTRPAAGSGQVFVLNLAGGEAQPITDLPRGASAPIWSPDGTHIAFSSTMKPEDGEKKDPSAPAKSDVRVITDAQYRNNGGGWADADRPSHVWVTDTSADRARRQTPAVDHRQNARKAHRPGLWMVRRYSSRLRALTAVFLSGQVELFSVPASGEELKRSRA